LPLDGNRLLAGPWRALAKPACNRCVPDADCGPTLGPEQAGRPIVLRCSENRGRLPRLQTCYRQSTLQRTRDKPMGIDDIWLFVGAGLLLYITPGPDMALIRVEHTNGDAGREGCRPWRGSRHARSLLRPGSCFHRPQVDRRSISPKSGIAMGANLFLIRRATRPATSLGCERSARDIHTGFSQQRSKPEGCRYSLASVSGWRLQSTPRASLEHHGKRGVERCRWAPTSARRKLTSPRLATSCIAANAHSPPLAADRWATAGSWLRSVRRVHWVNGTADTTVMVEASAQWRV
jgi:hypothetical protein